MKKAIAILVCCALLAGCASGEPAEITVQETAEAAAPAVVQSGEAGFFSAAEPEEQESEEASEPELFCSYDKQLVQNLAYRKFIAAVDEYAENCGYQGAVLVAWQDEIILAKGYGYADEKTGRLCTARDTFEVGSVSKQMTAAAILQLAENGALSLDDTLDKYFPQFAHGKNITIKNLLQMRSGLMDFINSPAQFFPEAFIEEYTAKADTDDVNAEALPRDFVLDYINDAPLCYSVDSCFSYCNTNYYLLGLIIEQVTGDSFQDYIGREIFDKCDMLTANNSFRDTTARGYYEDGTTESMALSTSLGCGSVNAGVYDIYQWIRHLFGGDVIGENLLAEMLTENEGYGYGMRIGENVYYHTGNTDCFNAFMAVYSDSLTVVALSNKPKVELNAAELGAEIHSIFADCYALSAEEAAGD